MVHFFVAVVKFESPGGHTDMTTSNSKQMDLRAVLVWLEGYMYSRSTLIRLSRSWFASLLLDFSHSMPL